MPAAAPTCPEQRIILPHHTPRSEAAAIAAPTVVPSPSRSKRRGCPCSTAGQGAAESLGPRRPKRREDPGSRSSGSACTRTIDECDGGDIPSAVVAGPPICPCIGYPIQFRQGHLREMQVSARASPWRFLGAGSSASVGLGRRGSRNVAIAAGRVPRWGTFQAGWAGRRRSNPGGLQPGWGSVGQARRVPRRRRPARSPCGAFRNPNACGCVFPFGSHPPTIRARCCSE